MWTCEYVVVFGGKEEETQEEKREKERERKTERETRRETRDETYAVLVSGSIRSEVDETVDFGWTTFPFQLFFVVALIVQLLRIVDIVKSNVCA